MIVAPAGVVSLSSSQRKSNEQRKKAKGKKKTGDS